jgi:hypothetical protein
MFRVRFCLMFLWDVFLAVMLNTATAYEGDGLVEPEENSDEELKRASQNSMAKRCGHGCHDTGCGSFCTVDKGHTTVWLPECKICIQNALWATPPNMYSIRGDLFRDAREWAELVNLVRDLKPETLIGYLQHDSPGKAKEPNWLPAPRVHSLQ